MISVSEVTKSFGRFTAVESLSFEVQRGEILGFLGPNGAGKTTTMRILTGFLPPTRGVARVAGHDIVEEPIAAKRKIGYLPENPPIYPEMTVTDYVDFVARLKGVSPGRRKAMVDAALDRCALGDVRTQIAGKLSKGYRQRLGLAQALVHEPEVLILDEPTAGLDPKQINETRELIKTLGGEHTVVLSTHILPEVSMTCERIVIINQGRLVAEGTPSGLTERFSGAGVLELLVEGATERVSELLSRVAGVARVSRGVARAGALAYHVEVLEGRDPRREIASAVVQAGFGLLELRERGMTLEDVYLRVVTSEAPEAVPPPPTETEAS